MSLVFSARAALRRVATVVPIAVALLASQASDARACAVCGASDAILRPGKVHGDDKVVMFGSWVASELPDGKDLPADMKWEGGVAGKLYVFKDRARTDMVCSFPKGDLPGLKIVQRSTGGELPRNVCAKKTCITDAIRANKAAEAKALCGL